MRDFDAAFLFGVPGTSTDFAHLICVARGRRRDALACNLNDQGMDKNHADPWLVWLASVLAAAVFVIYITHSV